MARLPVSKQLPIPAALIPHEVVDARTAAIIDLMNDTLITAEALAARWCLSQQTLSNNRRCQRGLPYLKLPVSGAVRYRLSDVVRAELKGSTGPIPPRHGGAMLESRHNGAPLSRNSFNEGGSFR